jgi:hypothetical protein
MARPTEDDYTPEPVDPYLAEAVDLTMQMIRALAESVQIQEETLGYSAEHWTRQTLKLVTLITNNAHRAQRLINAYGISRLNMGLSEMARIQASAPNSVKKWANETTEAVFEIMHGKLNRFRDNGIAYNQLLADIKRKRKVHPRIRQDDLGESD